MKWESSAIASSTSVLNDLWSGTANCGGILINLSLIRKPTFFFSNIVCNFPHSSTATDYTIIYSTFCTKWIRYFYPYILRFEYITDYSDLKDKDQIGGEC